MEEITRLLKEDREGLLDIINNALEEDNQEKQATKILAVKRKGGETIKVPKAKPKPKKGRGKRSPRTLERLERGRQKLKEKQERDRELKKAENQKRIANEHEEVKNILTTKVKETASELEERIHKLEQAYIGLTTRPKKKVLETDTESEVVIARRRKKPTKKHEETDVETDGSYVAPKLTLNDYKKRIFEGKS